MFVEANNLQEDINKDYENDVIVDDTPISKSFKSKNNEKFQRMIHREQRRPYMFYPEDVDKANWDLFMTVVLVYTCVATPSQIAFPPPGGVKLGWKIVRWTVDFLFLIDIFVIFNSALQDEDFKTIDDRKQIACEYLQGWFLLDVFAILPLENIFDLFGKEDSGNINSLARLAKIGRLYKLIKLTKLLRVLKIVKERSKLLKYVREVVKLGYGFERLVFMTLIFLLITHVVGCLWVFFASFREGYEGTWMDNDGHIGIDTNKLYLQSFYWTVTTITTVGYGDVSISTNLEKIFCIILMTMGVVGFGLLSGALTNILQNYDVQNAQFQEKVAILNRLYREYYLPLSLYLRLKQSIRYNYSKNQDDVNGFLEELPRNLAIELSLFVHEQTYKKIYFLKRNASESFLAWVCPLLKPSIFMDQEYIYLNGDEINCCFFMKQGECGFVLACNGNLKYIDITQGNYFGIIDILGSMLQNGNQDLHLSNNSDKLFRQFTV